MWAKVFMGWLVGLDIFGIDGILWFTFGGWFVFRILSLPFILIEITIGMVQLVERGSTGIKVQTGCIWMLVSFNGCSWMCCIIEYVYLYLS